MRDFVCRSGPRRPLIVNLSPFGVGLWPKDLSRGPLYGLRYAYVGSPKNERTSTSIDDTLRLTQTLYRKSFPLRGRPMA